MSEQAVETPERLKGIIFTVGQERFALPVEQVIEVVRLPQLMELAKAPETVIGVFNFRGQVIPVFDLRLILDFPPTPYNLSTPILVLRQDKKTFGLVIDKVQEVATLEVTPNKLKQLSSEAIKGLVMNEDDLVFFLDVEQLVSRTESKMLGKALQEFKQKNDSKAKPKNTNRTVAKV